MMPPARAGAPPVVRFALQLAGFAIGLGLLAWCIRSALSPANREQLENLRQAPFVDVAALGALTIASVVLNGLVFWAVLLPVRRLRAADLVAVNALATFLNYLPFKLSVISRVLIHNRRDGIPIFVIGGWFTAMGVVLALVMGPLVFAGAFAGRIDAPWAALAAGSLLAAGVLVVAVARALGRETGLQRIYTVIDALRLRPLSNLARARFVRDLHTGMAMLASPGAVGAAVGLRLIDTLVQATRFTIAARLVGHELGLGDAVLLSLAHFAVGILSPVGMLGFRESATTALAPLLAVGNAQAFAVIPLVVGAIDAAVNLAGAGAAIIWLRPGRILLGRSPAA